MTEEPLRYPLLSGIVGSTAYGLNHEGSDVDRMAVFAWPTREFFRLEEPKDYWQQQTPESDVAMFEAKKFIKLALKGNPTVSELLWLEHHEVATNAGFELVAMRRDLCSAPRVKDAYLGYARQQYHKLQETGSFSSALRNRTEKHARHLRRLVEQGYQLYTTGELTVRVSDPEAVMEFGRQVAKDPEFARDYMAVAVRRFEDVKSVLPNEPNYARAEEWLMDVRKEFNRDGL